MPNRFKPTRDGVQRTRIRVELAVSRDDCRDILCVAAVYTDVGKQIVDPDQETPTWDGDRIMQAVRTAIQSCGTRAAVNWSLGLDDADADKIDDWAKAQVDAAFGPEPERPTS